MKISYNWLKEIYPTDLSPEAIDILLTAGGLEVENIEAFETVKGGMKGLVVGEVMTCIKHPDADKLKLTTVDVGTGELLQIVCGGPNVAAGQKVELEADVKTKFYDKDIKGYNVVAEITGTDPVLKDEIVMLGGLPALPFGPEA